MGHVVAGKDHCAGTASKSVGDHGTLMADNGVRISVKCDRGGKRVFRNQHRCLRGDSIPDRHLGLTVGRDVIFLFIHQCEHTAAQDRKRESAVFVCDTGSVFRMAVSTDGHAGKR